MCVARRRLILFVLLCLTAAGCGSSSQASSDGSDEEAGLEVPETDTTVPQVETSTPTTVEPSRAGVGDAAIWVVDAAAPPSEGSDSFAALVTRPACSGGVTGEVYEPVLTIGETEIVVTFTVEPLPPGQYTCPSNDVVAYVVDVGEPVGRRDLVDGACVTGEAASTSVCSNGPLRWRDGTAPL